MVEFLVFAFGSFVILLIGYIVGVAADAKHADADRIRIEYWQARAQRAEADVDRLRKGLEDGPHDWQRDGDFADGSTMWCTTHSDWFEPSRCDARCVLISKAHELRPVMPGPHIKNMPWTGDGPYDWQTSGAL